MALQIVPYTPDLQPAVRRFNERMAAAHAAADFGISPESPAPRPPALVQANLHLAVDSAGEVRGGVIVQEHPGWVNGRVEMVLNLQSPLSEGIIDRRYAMTAIELIRFALKRSPFVYAVGMGNEQNALPRLLKASGWKVRPVPFFFLMLNIGRCLRALQPLQRTLFLKTAAKLAAGSGAGRLVGKLLQRSSAGVQGYRCDKLTSSGPVDDALWSRFRDRCSFSVVRDSSTLGLYCPRDAERFHLSLHGENRAWFSILVAAMDRHKYFGSLKIATVMDVVAATPSDAAPAMALAVEYAASEGCDLVLTNQIHQEIQTAARAAGFLRYDSNFLLATSKALTEQIQDATTFVTRQDGDGLVNLSGSGSSG